MSFRAGAQLQKVFSSYSKRTGAQMGGLGATAHKKQSPPRFFRANLQNLTFLFSPASHKTCDLITQSNFTAAQFEDEEKIRCSSSCFFMGNGTACFDYIFASRCKVRFCEEGGTHPAMYSRDLGALFSQKIYCPNMHCFSRSEE